MPIRSTTPGRKFWTNTSARATSWRRISRPASLARFSAIERLPRFATWNRPDMPPREEPTARSTSPAPGGSTLTTSAPWSASSVVASGPEMTAEQSTMRTPARGRSITPPASSRGQHTRGRRRAVARPGGCSYPPAPMTDAAGDLLRFIDRSPTPYHAVVEAVARLRAVGFTELAEAELWELSPGDARYVVRGGGSLFAFVVGERSPAEAGFHLVGAHTDSPNLRLKPLPDVSREGYRQLAVEPYGGVLLHSWLDRDLSLAGRVTLATPAGVAVRLVDFARPLLRVPNLAIHLQREIATKGLELNAQTHLVPVVGLEGAPPLAEL